ncbi:MAG TPA: hypothetical protein VGM92_02015, partial [Candidatus Kapabacteria bacterium]
MKMNCRATGFNVAALFAALFFGIVLFALAPRHADAQTRLLGAGGFVVDNGNGNAVTILTPPSLSTSYIYTLPAYPGGNLMSGYVQTGSGFGQVLYWNGTYWQPSAIGSTGQVLTLNGSGIPTWEGAGAGNFIVNGTSLQSSASFNIDGSGQVGTTLTAGGNMNTTGGAFQTNGTTRIDNSGNGTLHALTLTGLASGTAANYLAIDASNHVVLASGGGGMTNPMTTLGDMIFEDATPMPVRLAGNTTTTNKFLSQTGNGTLSSAPTWSTLGSSDIPDNAANTTGNAGNVTGTVLIAHGGTGQATQQAAIDALTGSQSSGTYLRSDGVHATLSSISVGDVPTLNQNTTGTAANVTDVVDIVHGGTGQATQQAAIDALTGSQSSGTYLRSDGVH